MAGPAAAPSEKLSSARVLELGCGKVRNAPDSFTVDIRPEAEPDLLHDLDELPWPLPDNQFDTIWMIHVVEHLDDIVATMEELHRIARPGARIIIRTPHYSSVNSFRDPTHRHHLGLQSFNYFTGEHEFDFYTTARFRTIRRELMFNDWPFAWLMRRIARRWPNYYEERLAWLHPALEMEIELEVLKS